MLVGVVNMDVVGSKYSVVAWSCGRLMGVWVGLAVSDMVGVVNVVPFGSNVTPEGGGSAGTVVLAGGCDTLALCITEFEAGMLVIWGGSRGTWGSLLLQEVYESTCVTVTIILGFLGLTSPVA